MFVKTKKILVSVLFLMTLIFFLRYSSWSFTQRITQMPAYSSPSTILTSNVLKMKEYRKKKLDLSLVMGRAHTTIEPGHFSYTRRNKKMSRLNYKRFLINTNNCKIRSIHPFLNGDFKSKIKRHRFKCHGPQRLTKLRDDKVVLKQFVNQKYYNGKVAYCRLKLIGRVYGTDDGFEYYSEIVFNRSAIFSGEFAIVLCYSQYKQLLQTDFHSRVYVKDKVKSKLFNKKHTGSLNVHLIGIDSTSRNSFIRQMPNLREFILRNMSAYEYPGLTKVGYNTLPNIIPLLTGKHLAETGWTAKRYFDQLDYIWKDYSEKGAITLLAEDRPRTGAFNFRKKGFFISPTDYYIRPLTMAIASQKNHSEFCIGSVSETDYILEYTRNFLDKFKDDFYFAFNFFTDWSHDKLNGASRWEGAMMDFFIWLQSTGKLNNTLLFFFSDHGFQMGGYRDSTSGKYESNLPFAFLIVPNWFKKAFPAKALALEMNQRRLTTFFDVYATLVENLIGTDSYYRSEKHKNRTRSVSLMTNVSSNRTCQMAGIPLSFCQCVFKKEKIDLNHRLARKAALAMVNNMNELIKTSARGKCARLTLDKIISAYKDSEQSRYLVTFSVLPSNGQFESIAWLLPNTDQFEVLTEAIRINMYGNQSHCVQDLKLIMICYCRQQK